MLLGVCVYVGAGSGCGVGGGGGGGGFILRFLQKNITYLLLL